MAAFIYIRDVYDACDDLKLARLVEIFSSESIFIADSADPPVHIFNAVNVFMRKDIDPEIAPVIFMGTGVGGFYANYFAQKWDCPCVLINPEPEPSRAFTDASLIEKHIRVNNKFDEADIRKLESMEREVRAIQSGVLVNLFVSPRDICTARSLEVSTYKYTNYTKVLNEGTHAAFGSFDLVIDWVKKGILAVPP